MRQALAICATSAVLTAVLGQYSTDFDVVLATPPTQDTNQFQLQNAVSVLISAGNVFYDPGFNNIPMQAFEITDQNGNPLGPFQMPTSNFQDYVLDVSSLNTGVGLKPYHRGVEMVDASDRGWRLDYYKNGTSGDVYSTVMSGPISQTGPGEYILRVDLMLRWSEEGDSLNRLGQGQFSHIALALADFSDFTLTIDAPGSGRMVANVFTQSPTSAAPTSQPSAPPSPGITSPETTVSTETPPLTSTTEEPGSGDVEQDRFDGDDQTFESCMETARIAAAARVADNAAHSKKKARVSPEERAICEQYKSTWCNGHYGKKGKHKKHKKCKKGKLGLGELGFNDAIQRSTMIAAGTAALVLVVGYAKVIQRNQRTSDYEDLDKSAVNPAPVKPTAIRAFEGHSTAKIYEDALTFHLPPGETTEF